MAVGNILGFSAGASGDWHKYAFFMCSLLCLRKHDYGSAVDVLFKIVIIHLI